MRTGRTANCAILIRMPHFYKLESDKDPCVTRGGILLAASVGVTATQVASVCSGNTTIPMILWNTTELVTASGGSKLMDLPMCSNGNEIRCSNGEIRFCRSDRSTTKVWSKFRMATGLLAKPTLANKGGDSSAKTTSFAQILRRSCGWLTTQLCSCISSLRLCVQRPMSGGQRHAR